MLYSDVLKSMFVLLTPSILLPVAEHVLLVLGPILIPFSFHLDWSQIRS